MDTLIIVAVGAVLAAVFVLPYFLGQRRLERKAEAAEAIALSRGLDEPTSLHPIVDPNSCIGTGNCIDACPEKDVLGLRFGQASPISPARCIGHGLCEQACPVDAITLVFGTSKRGVEIPRIQSNFETNVPGIYVVGELGGMGLIRNAFEQGRQCIDGIAAKPRNTDPDVLDVVVVGCGPAGLAAAINCKHHGLRFETIEREEIGGAVRTYPRKKVVMTHPIDVPGYGVLSFREIVKEELIDVWTDIIGTVGLEVRTGVAVESVERLPDGSFVVHTSNATLRARNVVLAIGRRGLPRKLGVPGEDLEKVAYSLREPAVYRGDRVLVVGGGDSAVEAALSLSEEPGTRVHLSYRRDAFRRIKDSNRERIERAASRGSVDLMFQTNVTRIEAGFVQVAAAGGESRTVENDALFVFAGGVMPTAFLERCGIRIDTKFGEPI